MLSYKNVNSNTRFILGQEINETEGCDESTIILLLTNGVGIIPTYVPLIIEFEDMEQTKYYSLSAAVRDCGVSKQTLLWL